MKGDYLKIMGNLRSLSEFHRDVDHWTRNGICVMCSANHLDLRKMNAEDKREYLSTAICPKCQMLLSNIAIEND
jgi:hypothetical protein